MLTIRIFTAAGCSRCKKIMKDMVDLLESLREDLPQINLKIINITERPEIAIKYGVITTPTILIGEEIFLRGSPTKRVLQETIKKSLVVKGKTA